MMTIRGNVSAFIAEKEIVNWFFNHPRNFKDYLFYEELGIDKSKYTPFFERVKKPIIEDNDLRKPGDLDHLIDRQRKTSAYNCCQVKRVKAIIDKQDKKYFYRTNPSSKRNYSNQKNV